MNLALLPSEAAYSSPALFAVDARGNLFGYSAGSGSGESGGINSGNLFELSKSRAGFTLQTLFTFDQATTGVYPVGATLTASGAIVGTTLFGPQLTRNQAGYGTVFSFANGTYSTLVAFDRSNAQNGLEGGGTPVVTASGAILATATYGGDITCSPLIQHKSVHKGCGLVLSYQP